MIEATNLTKRYGKTVAVNEVSFTVRSASQIARPLAVREWFLLMIRIVHCH